MTPVRLWTSFCLLAGVSALAAMPAGVRAADEQPLAYDLPLDALAAAQTGAAGASSSGAVVARAGVAKAATAKSTVGRLFVFGDSYSKLHRKGFPNWAEQLDSSGFVGSLAGYAVSGATAGPSSRTLAQQVGRWKSGHPGLTSRDDTVIYMGYNDIDGRQSLDPSKTAYKQALNTLVSGGATKSGRRIYMVMPHNVGSTPLYVNSKNASFYQSRTRLWDGFVAGLQHSYSNTVAVDLYSVIEKVRKNPKSYGFTNVTGYSSSRSASTYLYDDNFHFGRHGQAIIANTMRNYLNRGAKFAKSLQATRAVSQQRSADIGTGLAFNLAALDETQPLGLSAFPVGLAALPEAGPQADPTRAQFDQAQTPDRRDGGVGFNYGLGGGAMLGVVLSRYGDADREQDRSSFSEGRVSSQAVSMYLQQPLGAFELRTDLSYSRDRHEQLGFEDLVDQHSRQQFDGSTLSLGQRLGYPIKAHGLTVTPWAGLAYEVQKTDGFTISSPYTSEQTYGDTSVADTLASFGFDAQAAPIGLGEGASLTLFGGLSYTHGLAQDDYRVRVKEAAFDNEQDETVAREATRSVGLNLGASLLLGERLSLDGGLALDHDLAAGTAGTGRVGLTWRF